ncbi:hypothetical protein BDN72DRAFT_862319 [Pluteus cervinus]|uniref:Uncharacterized protein n=1 Tax=Pluteus cervinus TaxID=181527 RepID=A0ACD3ACI9_9AGAR|nr:hypothetical protein BDN72DRAFT_862319 [Pluteus cervinus]
MVHIDNRRRGSGNWIREKVEKMTQSGKAKVTGMVKVGYINETGCKQGEKAYSTAAVVNTILNQGKLPRFCPECPASRTDDRRDRLFLSSFPKTERGARLRGWWWPSAEDRGVAGEIGESSQVEFASSSRWEVLDEGTEWIDGLCMGQCHEGSMTGRRMGEAK